MNAQQPEDVLWDVALEALLVEHQRALNEPLNLLQLTGLADQHNIRLDDILDTLCKLTAHGDWEFLGKDGQVIEPDSDMCRMLHANHRLNDIQLDRLRGLWRPAG